MGRRLILYAVIALPTACYRPATEAPCTASCEMPGASGACPGEQVCGTDLRCHAATDDECSLRPDAPGEVCVGHAFLRVCFVPAGDVTLQGETINTDAELRCHSVNGAPNVCAIVGRNVTVAGAVTVTGTRAFAIAATDTILVEGTLDGASHTAGLAGPAANTPPPSCSTSMAPVSGIAGSGGFGGSLQGVGGAGGAGAGTGSERGGVPSGAVPSTSIVELSGPCASGSGSDGSGQNAGAGGAGGGAIALLATQLTIAGVVNVSGAGGAGGRPDNGGAGGGGAGGIALLDADTITVTGVVLANGGGGGGGAGVGGGADGAPGLEPTPNPPFTGVMGGSGGQLAGHGGAGGGSDLANGRLGLMSSMNAGGGGGGGVGYILTTLPGVSGMLSPAPIEISH